MRHCTWLVIGMLILPTRAALHAAWPALAPQASPQAPLVAQSVPIDWERIGRKPPSGDAVDLLAPLAREAVREAYKKVREYTPGADGVVPFTSNTESEIRTPAGLCRAIAVGMALGLDRGWKPKQKADARHRCVVVVRSLARAHKANGGIWGDAWQSALWSTNLTLAAWFLADELPEADQELVLTAAAHEADRYLDVPPPAWNGEGGDTKGEENAWNAAALFLASARLPRHPHAAAWRRMAVSYTLTALAMKRDVGSTTQVNGRPIKDWITGFNLSDEAMAANHDIYPHPAYTIAAIAGDKLAVFAALGGQDAPVAVSWNVAAVYRSLVNHQWPSPPNNPPGGTIYQPDGTIYWPGQGESDRARHYAAFANMDLTMLALHIVDAPASQAAGWEVEHLRRMKKSGTPNPGVNDGVNTAAISAYLLHWCLQAGAIRMSDAPEAAGIAAQDAPL